MKSAEFQAALLDWYRRERRELPWRGTRDPYAVWVSEVMLQQTTVAVVTPYYERWMAAFPDIAALSEAREDDVLRHWQGLGYYRRARSLHQAAKSLALGGLPRSHSEWSKVSGVGPYTAAAVASIALGEPVALVDGNVERVFARLNDDDATGGVLRARAWDWARATLVTGSPGDWNQALMELGAVVCPKARPNCPACPVQAHCKSLLNGTVQERPVAKPRVNAVLVEIDVLLVVRDGLVAVRRVPEGKWWAGLWELPSQPAVIGRKASPLALVRSVVTKHRVTLRLFAGDEPAACEWMSPGQVDGLALSSPMRRLWRQVRDRIEPATT